MKAETEKRTKNKGGRPKVIPSPDLLLDLFEAYCDHVDNHPWHRNELIKGGGLAGTIVRVPMDLPYTWDAFDTFLFERKIASSLKDYRINKNGSYSEFTGVIDYINKKMYKRNFSGASIGIFKENIIARYHGISDKQEIKASVEQPLFPEEPSD